MTIPQIPKTTQCELTAEEILCFAYLQHNRWDVGVIMVITLNGQDHVENLTVGTAHTSERGAAGQIVNNQGGTAVVLISLWSLHLIPLDSLLRLILKS